MAIYRHKDRYSIARCADFSMYQEADIMDLYQEWIFHAKDPAAGREDPGVSGEAEEHMDTAGCISGLTGKGYIMIQKPFCELCRNTICYLS